MNNVFTKFTFHAIESQFIKRYSKTLLQNISWGHLSYPNVRLQAD